MNYAYHRRTRGPRLTASTRRSHRRCRRMQGRPCTRRESSGQTASTYGKNGLRSVPRLKGRSRYSLLLRRCCWCGLCVAAVSNAAGAETRPRPFNEVTCGAKTHRCPRKGYMLSIRAITCICFGGHHVVIAQIIILLYCYIT